MRPRPRTRPTRILAACLLTLALLGALPGVATAFGDVDDEAFYGDAVAWMAAEGITTGVEPGCFGPTQRVTRGQIATFLYRLESAQGKDPQATSHPFVDVAAEYLDEPVGWLYASGVTTGTGPSTFSPAAPITRGDFAVMLWRYEGRPQPAGDHPFRDVSRAYQEHAVAWMADEAITTGTSPTTFDPEGLVTRAQAATFLYRYAGTPTTADPLEPIDCPREMRLALMAGGLTAAEATCAAPHLTDWSIEYLLDVVADRVDAAQDWDLLFTVSLIAQTCLTEERVAELTRLFL